MSGIEHGDAATATDSVWSAYWINGWRVHVSL